MPNSISKPLRILYAAGPGDLIGTYNYWINGQDDPSQVSITYSSQFYEVCCALDAEGYVISSCDKKELVHDGRFVLEHRPIPFCSASGLLYHLGQLWYGLRLLISAVRFRADVAVVSSGTTYWFVLSLLAWLGVPVVPSLHCVLWRKYASQRMVERLILRLSCNLFATGCTAILTASEDISEQVVQLTSNRHQPLVKFLPTYRRTEFADVTVPDNKRSPFRVLFAGRIERDKGVFDLLDIAKRFAAEGRQDITFDLCGGGSALELLCLAAKQARVDSCFVCHGHCNKPQMRKMFKRTHVVVVPTKTSFVEGSTKLWPRASCRVVL